MTTASPVPNRRAKPRGGVTAVFPSPGGHPSFNHCPYRPGTRRLTWPRVIDETFARATKRMQRAVVLLMQADMFDPTVSTPHCAAFSGFPPIVRRIAERSAAFGKPVYLLNGDSHVVNSDAPLAPGSTWLSFSDVPTPAPNLTRITVDGSTGVGNYLSLRVSVNNRSEPQVLTWAKVPFTATP